MIGIFSFTRNKAIYILPLRLFSFYSFAFFASLRFIMHHAIAIRFTPNAIPQICGYYSFTTKARSHNDVIHKGQAKHSFCESTLRFFASLRFIMHHAIAIRITPNTIPQICASAAIILSPQRHEATTMLSIKGRQNTAFVNPALRFFASLRFIMHHAIAIRFTLYSN